MHWVGDMWLRDPRDADIDHVCRRLRPGDVAEVYPLRYNRSPDDLIATMANSRSAAAVFFAAGVRFKASAIALVGVWELTPRAGVAQLVATTEFVEIVKPMTRYLRGELIPELKGYGMRRVMVHALDCLDANCRWIESLGAHVEAVCRQWGKDGQTYRQYVWLNEKEMATCVE